LSLSLSKTKKLRTDILKNGAKKTTRRESGKPKTDLFENRPLVGFRFIENRFGLGFPKGCTFYSLAAKGKKMKNGYS
jgi:hypothetical protein